MQSTSAADLFPHTVLLMVRPSHMHDAVCSTSHDICFFLVETACGPYGHDIELAEICAAWNSPPISEMTKDEYQVLGQRGWLTRIYESYKV